VFVTATCLDFCHAFRRAEMRTRMARRLVSDHLHYGAELHAYVVMPHHVHFVTRVPAERDISWFVQRVKTNSAKELLPLLTPEELAGFDEQRGLDGRSFWMRFGIRTRIRLGRGTRKRRRGIRGLRRRFTRGFRLGWRRRSGVWRRSAWLRCLRFRGIPMPPDAPSGGFYGALEIGGLYLFRQVCLRCERRISLQTARLEAWGFVWPLTLVVPGVFEWWLPFLEAAQTLVPSP
jgi:REP element-mobilizing transposase RayT